MVCNMSGRLNVRTKKDKEDFPSYLQYCSTGTSEEKEKLKSVAYDGMRWETIQVGLLILKLFVL